MKLLSLVALAALLLVWGGPPVAARGADSKVLAKKHFEKGELFYQQGEFRKALGEYKTAQQHFRHPAFIFNIAQCHRQLKEWEPALFFYRLYLSEAPGAPNKAEVDQRIKEAKAKIEEAKATAQQLGRVSVITRPEGASVRVDRFTGSAVAQSPAIVPLAPGQHLVQIELEGYKKVHRTVTVVSGQISMLELTLVPIPGRTISPPPREDPRRVAPPEDPRRVAPPEDPRRVAPRDDPRRVAPRQDPRRIVGPVGDGAAPRPLRRPFHKTWWFWTGAGGAVALAAAGSYAGMRALAAHQDFVEGGNPRDLDAAKMRAAVADLLLGLAGAAVITTVIVTALYERRRRADRPSAVITPSCGPTGCGLAITGRF